MWQQREWAYTHVSNSGHMHAHVQHMVRGCDLDAMLRTLSGFLASSHIVLASSSHVLHIQMQVIQETEAAYLKILESSQTLLTVLKRESINIQKKRQAAT